MQNGRSANGDAKRLAILALVALSSLVAGCASDEPTDDAVVEAKPAAVRGRVRIFGPPGGPLAGAEVHVLERPQMRTVTDAKGRFEFASVRPGDVTLVMVADTFHENQLGTHTLAGEPLEGMDFQAVSDGVFAVFASLAKADPDPTRCQVSTTVTRFFEGKVPKVHGEPGATATITPALPATHGPVYFNEAVLPTPGVTETSVDGGVVWTNVPPGDYTLRADKPGVAFEHVRIKCRPNVLVNAAPARGLQALNPGSGY